jgi:hypothetical protein
MSIIRALLSKIAIRLLYFCSTFAFVVVFRFGFRCRATVMQLEMGRS